MPIKGFLKSALPKNDSLKLAIIAGLVTGLAVHFGQEAHAGTLVHVTGWAAITLAFSMVITVQGFETSRYLGSE